MFKFGKIVSDIFKGQVQLKWRKDNMGELATPYQALFKDTFGTMVDISATNPFMLFSILSMPVTFSDLQAGVTSVGQGPSYSVSINKTSNEESIITYKVEGDAVFCLDFSKKTFIMDDKVEIKTVRGKGAYINDALLAFQGPDGIKIATQVMRDRFSSKVVQLIPTIVQYEGFDSMRSSYKGGKSPEDLEIEEMIKNNAPKV